MAQLGIIAKGLALAFCVSALAFMVLLTAAWPEARALKGVALVISQSAYEHLDPLANPANDAREIQKLLTDLGFEVSAVADRDRRRLTRELDRFVEDADGADVALLYFSGHGVEAGGENFLVPVDADDTALDAADARLVPLSSYVDELKRAVPVAIVLLDACRTNPFRPRALLKTEAAPAGLSVTPSGLGQPRGVSAMAARAIGGAENVGTVIGYAAEPGQAALDGPPGGNSPYADALVRHLSAMRGEEFGTVLRMVAEEVYLKTAGRQRPWVNESLRRLLYFGASPAEPGGAEGDILSERRQLLLTIAALPTPARAQIETIAASGDVPMDALYGMLRALGSDAPKDPAELDRLLRRQTGELKKLLAERDARQGTDPEVVRLSELAGMAMREGALETGIRLHEQIKARVGELSARLDADEADIKARRIEFAAAYGASAEAYGLSFDFRRAADDYQSAFDQVARFDPVLAWSYRLDQGLALWRHGDYKGDNAALAEAIQVYRDALAYAPRETRPADWVTTQNNIGVALVDLASRLGEEPLLRQAVAAHRLALEESPREKVPESWAWGQSSLANALLVLSERDNDPATFAEAVAAYRAVLEVRRRETQPVEWARTHQNLATALVGLARRTEDAALAEEAVASYNLALLEFRRDSIPLEWANSQSNLAVALRLLARLSQDQSLLEQAASAYRAVLEVRRRDLVPLDWATTNNNLGNVLLDRGVAARDGALIRQALASYDEALREQTLDRAPLDWAQTQSNRALAHMELASLNSDPRETETAVDLFRQALRGWTRERAPVDWAGTMINLGAALEKQAERSGSEPLYAEAAAAYRSALEGLDPVNSPSLWSSARNSMALLDYRRGIKKGDLELLRSAAAGYREKLGVKGRKNADFENTETSYNLGLAYTEIAKQTGAADDRRRAVAAYRDAIPGYAAKQKMLDVARTNGFLGNELLELAHAGNDAALAEEAAAAYRAALAAAPLIGADDKDEFDTASAENELGRALQFAGETSNSVEQLRAAHAAYLSAAAAFERAGKSSDRAISTSNAALALMSIADHGQGTDELDAAAGLLREALGYWTPETDRVQHAQATYNLARAIELTGRRRNDVAAMEQAARLYAVALDAWTRADAADGWAYNQMALGNILLLLADQDPAHTADLDRAIAAYRSAADVFAGDSHPASFAEIQNGIGYALNLIAERTGRTATFDGAVSAGRLALSAQLASGETGNLPAIRDTLCRALVGYGKARRDRAALDEASAQCTAAEKEFLAAGLSDAAAETAHNLELARAAIREIE
ncbi:MAG: caspase family protein [Mesorhizobium sp.]|nr:caspase family protein [Mesorhizobium sp.]